MLPTLLNHLFKENFSHRQEASVSFNDVSVVSAKFAVSFFSCWWFGNKAKWRLQIPGCPNFN